MKNPFMMFAVGVLLGIGAAYGLGALKGGDGKDAPDSGGEWRTKYEEAERRITSLVSLKTELEGDLVKAQSDLGAARDALAQARSIEVVPPPGPPEEMEPVDVPAVAGPLTEEEMKAGMKEFAKALQGIIMGTGGEAAVENLRALFARATPEDIDKLIERYGETASIQEKVIIAHAMAQSGNDQALAALLDIVQNSELGFVDRRMAAHGLAFMDDIDDVAPILREVAEHDEDRGTRANAAFGLARKGDQEGMRLYGEATDDAFKNSDPAALQYLSGFMLLGKEAMHMVRERLTTYDQPQALIVLIELSRSNKDRDALPNLHRLRDDPETEKSVRDAARKAITEIETE